MVLKIRSIALEGYQGYAGEVPSGLYVTESSTAFLNHD